VFGQGLTGCDPNGPYGALQPADANGIMLPNGFSSRVVARSNHVVPGTAYVWHAAPDGGATFATPDGGWVYSSNSELPIGAGGASALRFASDGTIVAAYRILGGTSVNCAGGPTPSGRWLSCEERDAGQVWECDPLGVDAAVARPALGVFKHEAAAVDAIRGHVYLTEDRTDGRLYRFVAAAFPDLSAGTLQVATVSGESVSWSVVPDPSAAVIPTRQQVPGSTAFNGGEGAWFGNDTLWFTTKGDNRVWKLAPATNKLTVIYDAATASNPILTGVDNIVRASNGDLYVAEDPGDLQLVLLRPNGRVFPFLQVTNQSGSELTGPAFSPSGSRLYFSSQRGGDGGITYEVSGPFAT
jgi:secreted PhoX family phosphatase